MKRRLAIVVMLGVGLAGLVMWVRPGNEPVYQGKPFRYWFKEYCSAWPDSSGAPDQFTGAIRAMGSNAVPYLVKELLSTNQDSRPRWVYLQIVDRLPGGLQRHMPGSVTFDQRRDKAADALFCTKPSAHVLVPLLTNALSGPDVMMRRRSLFVLGGVGESADAAVPHLVQALKDPDPMARTIAAQSLRFIGTDAKTAVPDLIEALGDPATRGNAVTALGNAGAYARPAIPSLRQLMTTTTNRHRVSIAAAIHKIDPGQPDAFTFLLECLKQRDDSELRSAAISELGALGAAATNAIPDLLEELRNSNINIWPRACGALQKIAPDSRIAVPVLLEKLANRSPSNSVNRLNAAANVVRIDPANATAQAELIEFVKSKSLFRGFAIEVLGAAGPAAKSALPVVKEALGDIDKIVRQSAADAVRKIEGERRP